MEDSGLAKDVEPKAQVFGRPSAKDRKVAWKEIIALSKLPEIFKKFKGLVYLKIKSQKTLLGTVVSKM